MTETPISQTDLSEVDTGRRSASWRQVQVLDRRREARCRRSQIIDREGALADRVAVELPVSFTEVIEGVSDEIERFAGAAGLVL